MTTSLPTEITAAIRRGEALAGDDLDARQLQQWYEQEKEAYYTENAESGRTDPWYAYMRQVNERLVFSRIRALANPGSIVFVGAGDGSEAVAFHATHPGWRFVFVEASESFRVELADRFPTAQILNANVSGDVEMKSDAADVVCAFHVLHHIANVSHVVREIFRITRPGGLFFVREPCSSMGDWRSKRSATPNERGISKRLMLRIAREAGFEVANRPVPVVFEPINKLLHRTIGYRAVPFPLLYAVDRAVSWAVAFNDHYWRDTWLKKIGPSSYNYVFSKPAA